MHKSRFSHLTLLTLLLASCNQVAINSQPLKTSNSNGSVTLQATEVKARTPPMGWNSWNQFACTSNLNATLIEGVASTIASSNLKNAGYRYVNIDDCWQAAQPYDLYSLDAWSKLRDPSIGNNIKIDKVRFPNGMKDLADKIHALGLKFGLYSDSGYMTCAARPGGLGYEDLDAQQYAAWGVDYLKYDYCLHNDGDVPDLDKITFSNPQVNSFGIEAEQATIAGGAAVMGCASCSGGKKVGYLGNNAGTMTFNVVAPAAGTYTMTLDYIQPNNYWFYGIRNLYVDVNNTQVIKHQYMPPTGNQNSWSTAVLGKANLSIPLQEGNNTIKIYQPNTTLAEQKTPYQNMKQALDQYAPNMIFSICAWSYKDWMPELGQLWRTTGDIEPTWENFTGIMEQNQKHAAVAGPGKWNDPDMIETGVVKGTKKLTASEGRVNFGMWSIMAAPLILGNDLKNMDADTRSTITNMEVIDLDQDLKGVQGRRIRDDGDLEVWSKPLNDGSYGVALLNRSTVPQNINVDWSELAITGSASVRSLWDKTELGSQASGFSQTVGGHDVVMLRVTPDSNKPHLRIYNTDPRAITSAKLTLTFKIAGAAHSTTYNLGGMNITHNMEFNAMGGTLNSTKGQWEGNFLSSTLQRDGLYALDIMNVDSRSITDLKAELNFTINGAAHQATKMLGNWTGTKTLQFNANGGAFNSTTNRWEGNFLN